MLSECTLVTSVLLFSFCLAFPADLIYRYNEGDHRSRSDLIDKYYPVDGSSSLGDDDWKIVYKKAAMGVDLPDYILHYKGGPSNLGNFRDKMEKNGK